MSGWPLCAWRVWSLRGGRDAQLAERLALGRPRKSGCRTPRGRPAGAQPARSGRPAPRAACPRPRCPPRHRESVQERQRRLSVRECHFGLDPAQPGRLGIGRGQIGLRLLLHLVVPALSSVPSTSISAAYRADLWPSGPSAPGEAVASGRQHPAPARADGPRHAYRSCSCTSGSATATARTGHDTGDDQRVRADLSERRGAGRAPSSAPSTGPVKRYRRNSGFVPSARRLPTGEVVPTIRRPQRHQSVPVSRYCPVACRGRFWWRAVRSWTVCHVWSERAAPFPDSAGSNVVVTGARPGDVDRAPGAAARPHRDSFRLPRRSAAARRASGRRTGPTRLIGGALPRLLDRRSCHRVDRQHGRGRAQLPLVFGRDAPAVAQRRVPDGFQPFSRRWRGSWPPARPVGPALLLGEPGEQVVHPFHLQPALPDRVEFHAQRRQHFPQQSTRSRTDRPKRSRAATTITARRPSARIRAASANNA